MCPVLPSRLSAVTEIRFLVIKDVSACFSNRGQFSNKAFEARFTTILYDRYFTVQLQFVGFEHLKLFA